MSDEKVIELVPKNEKAKEVVTNVRAEQLLLRLLDDVRSGEILSIGVTYVNKEGDFGYANAIGKAADRAVVVTAIELSKANLVEQLLDNCEFVE